MTFLFGLNPMFLDLVNQNKKIDSFLAEERQFPPLDNLLTQHCAIMVGYYNKGEGFFTLFCITTHRDYLMLFAGYCDIFSCCCKILQQVFFFGWLL